MQVRRNQVNVDKKENDNMSVSVASAKQTTILVHHYFGIVQFKYSILMTSCVDVFFKLFGEVLLLLD